MTMRFLFTTLQTYESEFYARVGEELRAHGHEVAHVTVSRASAQELRAQGIDARCLGDVAPPPASPPTSPPRSGGSRQTYDLPHIRDVYRADWACSGRSEEWCVTRTVRTFRALERVFDDVRPDVLVPEVGNETIRVAAHLIGLQRGIPVLFLLYTIFPDPLRLYVDTLHAPIAGQDEVRELTAEERDEVEAFRRSFTAEAKPIREHRRVPIEARRAKVLAGHVRRKATVDRDNDYLRPWRLLHTNASEWVRARAARPFYDGLERSDHVRDRSSTSRCTSRTTTRSRGSSRTAVTRSRWSSRSPTHCRSATTSCSRSTRCRSAATASACCAGCGGDRTCASSSRTRARTT